MNKHILFITPDESIKSLPIYVTGISDDYKEIYIDRPNGYIYDQISLCLQGEGFYSSPNINTTIKPNDIFFFRKSIPHIYYSTTDNMIIKWVSFDGYGASRMMDYLKYPDNAIFRADDVLISSLFTQIYRNVHNCNYYLASILLQELMFKVIFTPKKQNQIDRLNDVIKYIEQNYNKDISIDELSEISNTSVSYLCRIFKESYNCSPFQYILKFRINVAKEKLINTKMKIEDIALSTGFNQLEYFCSLFKKYEECTPTEFRKSFFN
jgi:AraC family transcriptional regulator of arabinose operon